MCILLGGLHICERNTHATPPEQVFLLMSDNLYHAYRYLSNRDFRHYSQLHGGGGRAERSELSCICMFLKELVFSNVPKYISNKRPWKAFPNKTNPDCSA